MNPISIMFIQIGLSIEMNSFEMSNPVSKDLNKCLESLKDDSIFEFKEALSFGF